MTPSRINVIVHRNANDTIRHYVVEPTGTFKKQVLELELGFEQTWQQRITSVVAAIVNLAGGDDSTIVHIRAADGDRSCELELTPA